jgi:NAD-dependent DNA ligase
MIYKSRHFFYSIKIGKVRINSISKSIKTITLNKKFALFNLDCTASIEHIKFCANSLSMPSPLKFLLKLTGEKQISSMQKKIELNKTKNCCLVVFGKNKREVKENTKKIKALLGFKEKKALFSKERLKKLMKEHELNKRALNGFGEDFYSAINNFFIEKSALVN